MQKVLRKRILRDFKENLARYLAITFLIVLSMYMVVSIVGSAETIIVGSKSADEEQCVEDGQFSLFVPMNSEDEEKLTDKGITLEKMFFLDYITDEEKTVRVYKNREDIDKIAVNKGRMAEAAGELLLERRYAEINDISVGDSVKLGGDTYTVVGIGTVPDYDSPLKSLGDTGVDSANFGLAFVTDDEYDRLKEEGKSSKSEEYYYAYLLNDSMTDTELKDMLKELEFSADDVSDKYFKEYWNENYGENAELIQSLTLLGIDVDELASDLGIGESEGEDTGSLLQFIKAEDNVRIQAASGDEELYISAGTVSGVVILILIAYVLSVFVVHSIDRESAVIGALYALGVRKKDLMRHYIFLPTLIAFVSGVIGTCLGYTKLGVNYQMSDCYNYFSIPDLDVVIVPYLLVYGIIIPPLICYLVTRAVISKRLSKPVLTMLKNEQKAGGGKDIRLKKMNFIKMFKIRQLIRERRTAFAVVLGMFVSMLLTVIALEIYVYCYNVEVQYVDDTKFEYMYTYKYPDAEVPDGGYKAYAKTLKKDIYGYDFDVTVVGLTEDNPFFDVTLSDSADKVTISSSIHYKYGLDVGDVITLKDEENEKLYAFEVEDIVQYSPSFMVFMSYKDALEVFGESEDYYNVVFSDHDLSIEGGRLYSVTSKSDVEKAAGVFTNQMSSMIITIGGISIVIFAIVLYLMMKVMVDRSSFNIALIKIFGYRNREVRRMYLDGNLYVVLLGAVISIPLSKLIIDAIYEPAFTPNVACGIDKSFPVWMYVAMLLVVIVLYFIINNLLVGRIKKTLPAEVLKNRE